MKLLFLTNIASVIFTKLLSASVVLPISNGTLQIDRNINDSTTEIAPSEDCPHSMSLFPTHENSTELICDCTFGYYVYYFETNSCYPAYERGPCSPEHYLVFSPGENLAKCEKNPCLEDGLVLYNGKCAPLWKRGPHCVLNGYLRVNSGDFEIVCTFQRTLNIVTAPQKVCPPGSRRNTLGNCKKSYE